jgi:outer membrane murein-binding lipoprotein Lpp
MKKYVVALAACLCFGIVVLFGGNALADDKKPTKGELEAQMAALQWKIKYHLAEVQIAKMYGEQVQKMLDEMKKKEKEENGTTDELEGAVE